MTHQLIEVSLMGQPNDPQFFLFSIYVVVCLNSLMTHSRVFGSRFVSVVPSGFAFRFAFR